MKRSWYACVHVLFYVNARGNRLLLYLLPLKKPPDLSITNFLGSHCYESSRRITRTRARTSSFILRKTERVKTPPSTFPSFSLLLYYLLLIYLMQYYTCFFFSPHSRIHAHESMHTHAPHRVATMLLIIIICCLYLFFCSFLCSTSVP